MKFLLPLFLLLFFSWKKESIQDIEGSSMGTSYRVKIASDYPKIKPEIENLLSEMNQKFSTYMENSEISRFNKFPTGKWWNASDHFFTVVSYALSVAKKVMGTLTLP